jgi:hypothetical protein
MAIKRRISKVGVTNKNASLPSVNVLNAGRTPDDEGEAFFVFSCEIICYAIKYIIV